MAPLENAHLFTSSPDWSAYVAANPAVIPPEVTPTLDVAAKRAADVALEAAWAAAHPIESCGYHKRTDTTPAGTKIAIYMPVGHSEADLPLAILCVMHGGGFVFGSSVTDEQWFLQGLLSRSKTRFAVLSIDYKLAPEYPYPTAEEECWATLQWLAESPEAIFRVQNVNESQIILAGSSAGAGLATRLAQKARDAGMKQIVGTVLNVPTLCHPKVFPRDEFEQGSYDQCRDGSGSNLRAEMMQQMWELYVPEATMDACVLASPFHRDTKGLVPHAVFVAGQDPLRDEGLAYAEKLRRSGVKVELRVFGGVPHNFGKIWELESCQRFQQQLVECLEWLLESSERVQTM